MPIKAEGVAVCSGFLTSKRVLKGCLRCTADLKLCKVKASTYADVSFLPPCADTHGPVTMRTHVLVGVLALTLGVIAGVVLVPDFSMP